MVIERAEKILQDYFGYDDFRDGQRAIIEALLSGRDVLGVLPTGGGKSLCYQIPALIMDGMAVVISPLLSLMKDQVDALEDMGVQAARMDSQQDLEYTREIWKRAKAGALKLLYVAPERLENGYFISQLADLDVSLVAVDEAHCVSQWGHDFRPSYRQIADRLAALPSRPVFAAFTATATERVRDDIVNQLGLQNPFSYVASFDRPNLYFNVLRPKNRKKELLDILGDDARTIIYASTRRTVETLTEYLNDHGVQATRYHAGLSAEERIYNQEDFIYDRVSVIVATNAFGMGIDKPDVRRVVHYNMPKNLESYYQEAGRAGRDGAPAEAILFFSAQDIMSQLFMIAQSNEPNVRDKLNQMIAYAHTGQCLRNYILHYFGEERPKPCGHCAICDGHISRRDVTVAAQKILSCIARMGQRFGYTLVVDVLRGKNNERVRQWHFEDLSTYGLLKDETDQFVRNLITVLASEGYIRVAGTDYPILMLTEKSAGLLSGSERFFISVWSSAKESPLMKKHRTAGFDEELFARLRKLRHILADNLSVPPYIIFSDDTLKDMCSQLPDSEEDLLHIHGVGEVKKKKYGGPFLSVIRNYLTEKQGGQ